jgi:hypothetical protein
MVVVIVREIVMMKVTNKNCGITAYNYSDPAFP